MHRALEAGTLTEAEVDRAVTRVLELVSRSQAALAPGQTYDEAAHHTLAREAAAASVVLLKNTDATLPLDPAAGGAVAVVGEFARSPRFGGGGSSQVTPTRLDDALSALREQVTGREVRFAPGFTLSDETPADEARALLDEAVAAARDAAVAVVFLGLPDAYESEGYDRDHMHLPPQQVAVLEAVAAVAERVVVVLTNGSVVEVGPWQHHAHALVESWLLGQAGGGAVADVLTVRSTRRGSWPRPCRSASSTTPPSATSPATGRRSATARASSSATAGTTRTRCRWPTPSGTA
ncbi:beta-glucosidase [Cellulomonas marina]|uniref:Beta-glucosidase n=1 Tax=Cellulomonas marina TaxID=988821 RepID=A0A1I0Z1H7_9CELL|nr:beta-glucosidase [Cellulomonas marina]